jgi:hypothetical protein
MAVPKDGWADPTRKVKVDLTTSVINPDALTFFYLHRNLFGSGLCNMF